MHYTFLHSYPQLQLPLQLKLQVVQRQRNNLCRFFKVTHFSIIKKNTNLKVTHFSILKNINPTRMPAHWPYLIVSGEGCICTGVYLLQEMYLPGGCTCLVGVPARGYLPGVHLPRYSPPTYRILDTSRKYYLAPNLFAGGNNELWTLCCKQYQTFFTLFWF